MKKVIITGIAAAACFAVSVGALYIYKKHFGSKEED